MIDKPLITISGKKSLLNSDLHRKIVQDLPQEGIEWRRRLDTNAKSVYVDVDLVEFDAIATSIQASSKSSDGPIKIEFTKVSGDSPQHTKLSEPRITPGPDKLADELSVNLTINEGSDQSPNVTIKTPSSQKLSAKKADDDLDDHRAFFNRTLLGQPILHTYWADKTDFEVENKKTQFEDWIGQVQASNCTEWAIIIIEDGDFKAQIGTALFKSKLQSSTGQSNISSSSISSQIHGTSTSSSSSHSFLDRMKKSLSTMFNSDVHSDRWLSLINQESGGSSGNAKAQESYTQFIRKFRNIIMASFSKQIELFEEQLRVQREIRNDKNWNFFSYFSMQEELAFAYEFLTLFDEALMQYDLLEALFTEHLRDETPYKQWITFDHWNALCLDLNSDYHKKLRGRIVDKQASLLDIRNYLYAKQCDLMLLQNQPWRVAASTIIFIKNCITEHERLKIDTFPGALDGWAFITALEVLQKCECYSCTSTMENYSYHTVDIWNYARKKLLDLGKLFHRMPEMEFTSGDADHLEKLFLGFGDDPHEGVSYNKNEISPQARLKDAMASSDQFSKHLIELSELTLGTYKHIGRKRHALLIGKELAEFYLAQNNLKRALPFLIDFERLLIAEKWTPLLEDIRRLIMLCNIPEEKKDVVAV